MGAVHSTGSSQNVTANGSHNVSPRLHAGLALLMDAYHYAHDLRREQWDFAVEIRCLERCGVTRSDLRWLVCKGYLNHAHEIEAAQGERRDFQCDKRLIFNKRTCFVLTETGSRFAGRVQRELQAAGARQLHLLSRNGKSLVAGNGALSSWWNGNGFLRPHRPTWDGERHELRVGDQLVKVFKLPSPNQETVLMAFEEEGWPPRIDDPLAPTPEIDPKRRLHDTLKSLNRNQKNRLLRFMGDGTGEGVRWELIVDN